MESLIQCGPRRGSGCGTTCSSQKMVCGGLSNSLSRSQGTMAHRPSARRRRRIAPRRPEAREQLLDVSASFPVVDLRGVSPFTPLAHCPARFGGRQRGVANVIRPFAACQIGGGALAGSGLERDDAGGLEDAAQLFNRASGILARLLLEPTLVERFVHLLLCQT